MKNVNTAINTKSTIKQLKNIQAQAKTIALTLDKEIVEAEKGKIHINVKAGKNYEIIVKDGESINTDFYVESKKVGNDLEVALEESVIIFDNYFEICALDLSCLVSLPIQGDGMFYVTFEDFSNYADGELAYSYSGNSGEIIASESSVDSYSTLNMLGLAALGVATMVLDESAEKPPSTVDTVNGKITLGPVATNNDLKVEAFVNGELVSDKSTINADGTFSINLKKALPINAVVTLKLTDGSASNTPDYLDEATGLAKDLDDAGLRAIIVLHSGQFISITPLTDIAAKNIDKSSDMSTNNVNNINSQIAKIFAIEGDITTTAVIAVIDGQAQVVAGNAYGQALAVISQMEKTTGMSTSEITKMISDKIDSGEITDPAIKVLLKVAQTEAAMTYEINVNKNFESPTIQILDKNATEAEATMAGQIKVTAEKGEKITMTFMGEIPNSSVTRSFPNADGNTENVTLTSAELNTLGDGLIRISVFSGEADSKSIEVVSNFTLDRKAPDALNIALNNDTGSSSADGITNDGVVKINNLEDNATWKYSTNDGVNWHDGSGDEFTLAGTTGTTYAADTIQVKQTDVAGNVSTVSKINDAITVDTVVPVFNSTDKGTGVVGQKVAYDANASDNSGNIDAGITYTINDAAKATFDIDTNTGVVTYKNVQTDKTDSTHPASQITVTATDTAGNTMDQAVTITVVSKPVINSISSSVTGTKKGDFSAVFTLTMSEEVDILGGTPTITLQVGSTEFTANYASGTGTNTLMLTAATIPTTGDGAITVKSINLNGATVTGKISNQTWETSVVNQAVSGLTIDNTAPDALNVALNNDTGSSSTDGITNDGTVKITNLKANSTWQYSTDNGVNWHNGSGDEFTLAGTTGTTYAADTIQVKQTDVAGNVSTVSKINDAITVDTVVPVFNSTDKGTGVVGQKVAYDANASDNSGNIDAGITYTINDAAKATFDIDTNTGVVTYKNVQTDKTDSTHPASQITVTATDTAGNTMDQAVTITVVSKPVINSISSSVTGTKKGDFSAVFTLTMSEEVDILGGTPTITLQVGSTEFTANYASGTGTNTLMLTAATIPTTGDGAITVKSINLNGATVTGKISNQTWETNVVSQAVSGLTIDNTAPDALNVALNNDTGSSSTDGITNDGTVKITNLKANSTWQYSTDNGVNWHNGSGDEFTLAGTAGTTYAAGFIQVKQTDVAGNVSTVSKINDAITVDTIAPLFNSIDKGTGVVGQKVAYDANASDNSGNIDAGITYTINDAAKATFDIDANTGVVTYQMAPSAETDNTHPASQITVTATDTAGNTMDQTVTITVVSKPVINSISSSVTGTKKGNFSDAFTLTMSEAVDILGGTPTITLQVGSTEFIANYASGTGTNTLMLTAATIPTTGDGAITVKSINLNGATVTGKISNQAWETNVVGQVVAGLTIDNTAPDALNVALNNDTGSSSTDGITSDGTVKITNLKANSTWQYSTDNGVNWHNGSGDGFTLAGTTGTSYASGFIQVKQTDVVGNVSTVSKINNAITVDNFAPVFESGNNGTGVVGQTIAYDANARSYPSNLDVGIIYTINDAAKATFNIDANTGVVTYKVAPTDETDSNHPASQFTVTATDIAGNTQNRAVTVTVVNKPVINSISSSVTGTKKGDFSAVFTLTMSEAVDVSGGTPTITLQVGSTEFTANYASGTGTNTLMLAATNVPVTGDGAVTVKSINLNNATVRGKISGEDWNINAVNQAVVGLTIDNTAPDALNVALSDDTGSLSDDGITKDGVVKITNLKANSIWQYSTNNGVDWNHGSGESFFLSAGTYAADTIQVRQSDTVGNVSVVSKINQDIVIDVSAPSKALNSALTVNDADGSSDYSIGDIINFKFSEGIQNIDVNNFSINNSHNFGTGASSSVSGDTVQVTLGSNTNLTVGDVISINNTNILDLAGNAAGATGTIDFSAIGFEPTGSSKIDGANNIDVRTPIVLTFSEAIKKGTGDIVFVDNNTTATPYTDGAGTIYQTTGWQNDNITNTQTIAISSDKVTISADGRTVTIDPEYDFDFATEYKIKADSGVFLGKDNDVKSVLIDMVFHTVTPKKDASNILEADKTQLSKKQIAGSDVLVDSNYWIDGQQSTPSGPFISLEAGNKDIAIALSYIYKDTDKSTNVTKGGHIRLFGVTDNNDIIYGDIGNDAIYQSDSNPDGRPYNSDWGPTNGKPSKTISSSVAGGAVMITFADLTIGIIDDNHLETQGHGMVIYQ